MLKLRTTCQNRATGSTLKLTFVFDETLRKVAQDHKQSILVYVETKFMVRFSLWLILYGDVLPDFPPILAVLDVLDQVSSCNMLRKWLLMFIYNTWTNYWRLRMLETYVFKIRRFRWVIAWKKIFWADAPIFFKIFSKWSLMNRDHRKNTPVTLWDVSRSFCMVSTSRFYTFKYVFMKNES